MVLFDFELNRFRVFAAIFLLISLAVYLVVTSIGQLQYASSNWKFNGNLLDDPISMSNRLKLLEARLPPNGSIGYLSEEDIPGMGFNPTDQDEEFAMSQYALAPRILIRGAAPDLVILNIPNMTSEDMLRIASPFGLTLVEKFDFGLYLYRH